MICGRVIKTSGSLCCVDTDFGIFDCTIRGNLRLDNICPIVGDFVEILPSSASPHDAVILKINPRKNELLRPKVSNIDLVMIVFSFTKPKINFDFLDKLLIYFENIKLEVLLCFNKYDIATQDQIDFIQNVYKKIGYNIVFYSTFDNNNNNNIDTLKILLKNKTTVLAGPSGVGKSSLFNTISPPKHHMKIGDLSQKIQRGKNTTNYTTLIKLDHNSFIADSPGFTSISLNNIEPFNLHYNFIEFRQFIGTCKYINCSHIDESFCEIKNNINDIIPAVRYKRYVDFYIELCKRRK